MKVLTHLSLFSGIGGLDMAAEWAGMRTIGQCEWAEYPTKVLERHWPDVPRWKDIRELTRESFYERTGRWTVDVVSGGFPCQPFSVAGKQRGKEDDRYLWPEMVRVVKELRPTWVVGENVAGIVRMALPDILSELEACGYRTRAFLVPACAVGARHRRYRVAIVAHAGHDVLPGWEHKEEGSEWTAFHEPAPCCGGGCGEPGDVREQQRRAELERAGEAMADTKIFNEGGLPFGEEEEKPGPGFCGKDVQHTDSPGCKEQHAPEEPDEQGFSGGGCNEGNVCHSTGEGFSDGTGEQMGGQGAQKPELERPDSHVPDTDNGSRDVRRDRELSAVEETGRERCDFGDGEEEYESRKGWSIKSELGGMADGIPDWVDGYWDIEPDIPRVTAGARHRVDRLKALGNAVVPQQFYPFFRAIVDAERTCR